MPAESRPAGISQGCPDVIAALDLKKSGLLEASAGTGKTYAIEHLVLRLLLEVPDLELPEILVLTFTEKATGELQDKIRARIASRLAQGGLSAAAAARLGRAHLEFDRASIHTIHGFCQRILRKYAFENNALFKQELQKNRTEVLDTVLYEEMRSTWLAGTEGAGLEAFRARAKSLRLGARSKWKDRITKVAKEFNPERGDVLLPEFSPARIAALEAGMAEALREAAAMVPGVVVGEETRHDFALRFAAIAFKSKPTREKGLAIVLAALRAGTRAAAAEPRAGVDIAVALLAESKGTGLRGYDKEGFLFLLPGVADPPGSGWPGLESFLACLERIRSAASAIEREQIAEGYRPQREVILDLHSKTRAWLRENGFITYDSMIEDVCLALRGKAERVELLRREYRFCLVDEFQDTDPLQWEIFRRIFLESANANPLFLIGDPKQAIYRFRGGDVYTYMEARKDMLALSRAGKAQGLGLDTNYRSSAGMVAGYNAAFIHSQWFHTYAVDAADKDWRLPAEPDPLGYVPVKAGSLDVQKAQDGSGTPKPILLADFSQGPADAKTLRKRLGRWMVESIAGLMADPDRLRIPDKATGSLRALAWSDICILVRKSKEATYLEKILTEAGIPVQVSRRTGLYHGDAAAQYLAVLESLADPTDTGKHARALLTRFFRAAGDAPPDRPPATPHTLFETWIRLAARRRWQRLFHSLLYRSGLLYREAFLPVADRSIMDFTHIGQNLVRDALADNLGMEGLVQRLRDLCAAPKGAEEDADMHREASEGGKVSLMTMHVSKGLEFPVVFVASWSGNPPATHLKYRAGLNTVYHLDTKDADGLAAYAAESEGEDRRLYYVALTRARYKLFLPLLPPSKGRTDTGPMGAFVAAALRAAAAAHPELYDYGPYEDPPALPLPAALPVIPAGVIVPAPAPAIASTPSEADPLSGYPREDLLAGADFPLRRRRLASYSQLVRHGHGLSAETVEGRFDKEEAPAAPAAEAEAGEDPVTAEIPGNALPRGKDTGNMFHEILEDIDFATVGRAASPQEMMVDAAVRELIDARLLEYRIDPVWRDGVAAVLWNVLTEKLPDPSGGPPFRLADVAERLPEMEFLFPYGMRPGQSGPDGYLWGFIDLVFRQNGRYYLLDWKSNHLDTYSPADLDRSMRESRYDVQYRLYSLALDKWLKAMLPDYDHARHFGGVYYLYLRGMDAGGIGSDGVFALKPEADALRGEYPESLAALLAASGPVSAGGRLNAASLFPESGEGGLP